MRTKDAEALAGRLLVVGFHGSTLPEQVLRWAEADGLGGIILFARNIVSQPQLGSLTSTFHSARAACSSFALVAIDQEGGRVERIREGYVRRFPPMRDFAATHALEEIEDAFAELGADLRRLGFNVDFAPVLDVDTNPNNPVIGDRAFANNPEDVASRGLACARGLLRGGVIPCGKHFPGHGDTDLDSHLALPRVVHPWSRLEKVELAPFAAFAHASMPMIMTAHVHFDALDPGVPATLSSIWLERVLRQRLGFSGVVVSDDLEMKAVSESAPPDELAVRMVQAGCDLLLMCSDLEKAAVARAGLASKIYDDNEFRRRAERSDARRNELRTRI